MKKEEYKRKMLSFTSMFHLDQKEQIRTFVSYQSFDKNERVVVSLPNLEWSWELFLSILKWKNDGSKIDIYFENRLFQSGKRSDSLKEKVRIRTLSYMGINLHLSIKSLPSYGYFFQKNGNWSAVVINELIDRNKVKAKVLSEESDSAIIQTLVQSLNNHETRSFEPKNITNIALCPIDEGVILSCLKTIPIYKDADMAFEDIEVNQVFFMTRYVLGYKFRMMDVLVHSYGNESIFGAAAFEFAERQLSYIGPPVVEYCNEKYVIINGNTRFLYAYKNNIKTIRTVVVRNVNTPLMTCKRYTQSQMSVSDNLMKAETRYGEWDYAKYRPIEQAVRPYKTYLK